MSAPNPRRLRVRVTLSLTVDVDAWAEAFGVAPADLREDVIRYVTTTVTEHLAGQGLLANHRPH